MQNFMKWHCKRCESIFTEENRLLWKSDVIDCPCDCKKKGYPSPSPWEQLPTVYIKKDR